MPLNCALVTAEISRENDLGWCSSQWYTFLNVFHFSVKEFALFLVDILQLYNSVVIYTHICM